MAEATPTTLPAGICQAKRNGKQKQLSQ